MRNEANLRRKWLIRHGGGRFGSRGGLEILESFERAEEHAVGSVDAALEAGEGVESVLEGMAERGIVLDLGVEELSAVCGRVIDAGLAE